MPDIFVEPNEAEAEPKAETSPETVKARWLEAHKNTVSLLQNRVKKPGMFTSFAPRPLGLSFDTQEPDEVIVLLLRRHFITNLPWLIFAGILALIPLLILPFLQSDFFSFLTVFLSGTHLLIILALYYLVILGFALTQYATWYYQVGIITSMRVIDVDFNSLLSKNIAYTELEDIVDVEAVQNGLLQSFFNFGDVLIQTEGMKPNFEFNRIPQPNAVADTLSDLMRGMRRHA